MTGPAGEGQPSRSSATSSATSSTVANAATVGARRTGPEPEQVLSQALRAMAGDPGKVTPVGRTATAGDFSRWLIIAVLVGLVIGVIAGVVAVI